ncbi:MAG: hypothetical protein K1V90_08380 [Muribaculaceae bacterium]|jgi:transcriptional regulator with XRE-family HTH domain
MNDVNETVKDRLTRFLRAEGISKSEFARRMGLSTAYIGAMRKSMPEDKVLRMMELFPRLNRDWLLYGEGDMYREIRPGAAARLPSIDSHIVPLLPVEAFAGNLQMYSQGVELSQCEKVVSPVKGVDFAIRVSGDSMEPEIMNGSILYIKRINDRGIIPWGHPVVIDTENGVLVKMIDPSGDSDPYDDSDGNIEAKSYNEKYPPLRIQKSTIYGLYRIVAQVRLGNYI